MHKYLAIFMVFVLVSCSSNSKKVPIKFVNHSIPEQDANITFSIDSDYCTHKVLKDRPYVYEKCKFYTNPAMRKNCLNDNKGRLNAYKTLTLKLYKRCLEGRGWQEDVPTKKNNSSIEAIERIAPVYPVEAISLCVEAKVKVGFIIAKDGLVKGVRIIEAKPEGIFDGAVISAVSTWRFKPIMDNTELIEQYVIQELIFKPYESCGQEIEIPAE